MASTNPVMVITGTSRGIGRGMAEHYLAMGYTIFGCSRGEATIENDSYHHMQVDIGDELQVRAWVRHVKKSVPEIDILVCNAGMVQSVLPMTVTPGSLVESYLRTNFAGTYLVCREFAKAMILQRQGRIITISSIMTCLHESGTSLYSATKSAIVEMTKVLARELAPLGITCNVIALSLVQTEASQAFGEEWKNRILEKQTLKRPVTIAEICNIVSFYSAPESACITGEVIHMGLIT
jgi:3-oxoacyl-[acyl-carrier protein] reductase